MLKMEERELFKGVLAEKSGCFDLPVMVDILCSQLSLTEDNVQQQMSSPRPLWQWISDKTRLLTGMLCGAFRNTTDL